MLTWNDKVPLRRLTIKVDERFKHTLREMSCTCSDLPALVVLHRLHLYGVGQVGTFCPGAFVTINNLEAAVAVELIQSLTAHLTQVGSTVFWAHVKKITFKCNAPPTGITGRRVEGPPCPVLDRELPQPAGRLEVLAQTGWIWHPPRETGP